MTPNDENPKKLLDDIYTMAYWMTGSKDSANHLVYRTYLNVQPDTPKIEIFKTFRKAYFESFIDGKISCIPEPTCNPMKQMGEDLVKQEADVKLCVLLSEIANLKPTAIAKIIDRPVSSINSWLSSGRAWLTNTSISSNGHGKLDSVAKDEDLT